MLCLKVRNTQQYIPCKYVIAARSIALFRNEKGWNFLIKILEYYEVDVNEYVPEFKFKLETIKHIQQLIHQGDYLPWILVSGKKVYQKMKVV